MKVALLGLAFAWMGVAQTFPVAGTVVDSGSGSPMGRVRVTLTPYGRSTGQMVQFTAGDGKFSFEVPKGKFVLVAEYRGFREPFGQSAAGVGFNVAIFTGPDQDASNLVFKWFAPGAITGKVTDDHGEPVEDALVQLVRTSVVGGRKSRATVAWARTDDRGEYRFGERSGGTYYLAVTGEPWTVTLSKNLSLPGKEADAAEEPTAAYVPVYYPNAFEPKNAQPLELAPGAEVTADFRLSTVTGVNVHVRSPHKVGEDALITLLSDGVAGVDANQRQVWLMGFEQEQTIPGVLPGHYLVTVKGQHGNTAFGRKAIEVGQADVSVEIPTQPAATVRGKVVFQDPNRRPRRAAYVRLIDEAGASGVLARQIDGNGEFLFENVPPSRRRLQMTGADGFFAARITAEGGAVDGPVIDVEPGAEVKVTIASNDEIGSLKGFVMNGDKPVAGVLAVLAPKVASKDPLDYRGFQTDSDGSFDYQGVRAGDYVLFAVEKLDLEYANPEVVKGYVASGKAIHIAAHGAVVENTQISAANP